MLNEADEKGIVELLAIIYSRIPWGTKIKTSKNPHDVFNHRVRAAAKRSTVYQFVSKLCNYFGMQTIPIETQELVDSLRQNEMNVLNVLSIEHIPYCVRGIIRAKEIKKDREIKKNEEVKKLRRTKK